jgi:hypothetical protein
MLLALECICVAGDVVPAHGVFDETNGARSYSIFRCESCRLILMDRYADTIAGHSDFRFFIFTRAAFRSNFNSPPQKRFPASRGLRRRAWDPG